jgi:hypothetical protein
MTTEFELSSRLVVWGDALDPGTIAGFLGIDPSSASTITKGSPLLRPDGTSSGAVAKTGRLTLTFDEKYPQTRSDPELQLAKAAETLRASTDPISSLIGVEKAQMQLFFYYKVKLTGESDFMVPELLLSELVRNRLSLSITILP